MPVEATAIPDLLFERGLYWVSGRSGLADIVAVHKWFNLATLKWQRCDCAPPRGRRAKVGRGDHTRPAKCARLDQRTLNRSSLKSTYPGRSRALRVALPRRSRRLEEKSCRPRIHVSGNAAPGPRQDLLREGHASKCHAEAEVLSGISRPAAVSDCRGD